MLHIRLEGDEQEARSFLAALAAAGLEVQLGTVKARREGFHHVYASLRMPGYVPPADSKQQPVKVPAARRTIGRRGTDDRR